MNRKQLIRKIREGIIDLLINGCIQSKLVVYVSPKDLKMLIPKGYKSMTIRDIPVITNNDVPINNYYILEAEGKKHRR